MNCVKDAKKVYTCEHCNYITYRKAEYDRHLKTKKHNKNLESKCEDMFTCCTCGIVYKSRQGLWRHQKTCVPEGKQDIKSEIIVSQPDPNVTDIFATPIEISVEHQIKLKELELEEKKLEIQRDIEKEKLKLQQETNITQSKMMEEMCNSQKMIGTAIEKMGTTTNNTMNNSNNNSNNTVNHFNLQVFLNDTCKDAMNIMDFVKSLKYTPEDIDRVGRLGYAEAISKLMIEGLNELHETQRPIHCTDAKREKMYVRHDNEWKKDVDSASNLKKAIKVVGHQNMATLEEWKTKHPLHNQPTSKQHTDYLEICNQTMTGMLDEDDKEFKKILKKIVPETTISKDKGIKE